MQYFSFVFGFYYLLLLYLSLIIIVTWNTILWYCIYTSGHYRASWTCGLISFISVGKYSVITSLNIAPALLTTISFWDSIYMLDLLTESHMSMSLFCILYFLSLCAAAWRFSVGLPSSSPILLSIMSSNYYCYWYCLFSSRIWHLIWSYRFKSLIHPLYFQPFSPWSYHIYLVT